MSKGFSINDILGDTKANAPAGQKMQVVMLPATDIEPNPENSIYEIGDVSMLKADIAERGLRSPLEVLPAKGGRYMLIAGHRRWTACRALTAEGVAGFEVLPCVIRQSQGEDDDLIALITSNATARELTDGERLRQYRALKQALERKKAAGALDGRIRDEMSRITGDGTGTLGRFNAILNNCTAEVVEMLEKGEITMTRAYECSKLYKVQQVEYAKNKYASMPPITDMARRAAIKYLVECGLADQLKKLDYVRKSEWNYADRGLDTHKMEPVTLDLTESETDALLNIEPDGYYGFRVRMLDPADTNEVVAENLLSTQELFDAAKRLYINKDDLAAYKAEVKGKACRDELKYGCAFATLSADTAIGCKIRFHSPATAAALWSGEKGRIACGLAIIDTVPDEHLTGVWQPRVVNLYMDNAVTVLRRRQDGWNVQRLPHRMGRPLMEPLIWNATSGKPFGRSRLKRSIRTLIDDYIRTVANATIALEFDTTPQKYILGVTDEQYDVLISDKFKSYVGSLLAATSNPETGENPVFGQLAQGSLSPHTEKMRMTATQFAAATGLTVTDVGVVNDANPTSSDAILAQSQTLVLLAQQLNTGNGDALRTIAQMAQAILRNVPPGALTEEERNVMPHFKNPAMPSVAVTADAAIKIATAREEFASTDTFLEMIGFDQADIRRIRAQEQRVRGQQVLMEMEDENNDAGVGDVHPQAGAAE